YTNEDLSKIHLNDEDLGILNLAKPSFPVYSYDASAALGGAIIKDKIWYMGEFRYQRSLRKGDFRPTVILGKQYDNYDRLFPNYIGYLKLTFQLAKNLRGSAMGHYSEQDVMYYYGGWNLTNEANRHNNPRRLNYAGTLTWFINNNNLLNLRIGGLYFKWTGVPTKDANPEGPMFVDRYTGYRWGTVDYQYTYKPSINIALSLTKYVDDFLGGNHEFKAGIEWQRNRGDWGFYAKKNMTWYYYNENPYYWRALNNGQTDPVYGDGQLTFQAIGKDYGESYETGITSRFGGFVQDMFTLKRLTISAGVRLDTINCWVPGRTKGAAGDPLSITIGEYYFEPSYGINPYEELAYPTWKDAFPYGVFISPRLGFTLDVFGNHKTALKGSFSHQAEPFPTGIFSGMYPLTYRAFTFNWWDLNENGIPDAPPIDQYQEAYGANPLAMIGDSYLKAIDPNVKPPYVDEFNIALEHELLQDFKVGVGYVFKKRGDILDTVLWDEQTNRYWNTYEKAPEWWVPFTTTVPAYGVFPEREVTMYFLSNDAPEMFYRLTNVPEASWKSRSFEIFFNKRMSKGWMLGGSVNFMKSVGNFPVGWSGMYSWGVLSTPNGFVNGYGELPGSRPLIMKLYGTFVLPYRILFSFFYQHIDGTPWHRTVTVVPPTQWASEHNARTIAYSINVEPRGSRRNEASDNIDIRLEKTFKLGPGDIGFYVDVFNLLGSYTLNVSKNPAGTWRPVDENTSEGTYSPTSVGLKGFSGYREIRFSFVYKF
ncbi:MAG: TonB-dependent receptor, partial [Candidatus Aminicenantes bacterium]|nr:TonB-dependent receptor [Candidatus Aminicenantes bacterium]